VKYVALRIRKGVSEIASIAILLLIAVTLGSVVYVASVNTISSLYNNVKTRVELAEANLAQITVLDAYYYGGNVTIILYIPKDLTFNPNFVRAYIDGSEVPSNDLLVGFNQLIPLGTTHELVIASNLSVGTHVVKLIMSNGAELEVVVNVS